MEYFNMVKGFPIDYMHCVLLGVVKQITKDFFSQQKRETNTTFQKKVFDCNKFCTHKVNSNNYCSFLRHAHYQEKMVKGKGFFRNKP